MHDTKITRSSRTPLEQPQVPGIAAGADRAVPFGTINGGLAGAHQIDVKEFQADLLSRMLMYGCTPEAGASSSSALPYATATDVIHVWVLRQLGIPADGTAFVGAPVLDDSGLDYGRVAEFKAEWERASVGQRKLWLTMNRTAITACSATVRDMGNVGDVR